MSNEINYSKTEQFVLEQVPGIQIAYHQTSKGDMPDWPLTLRLLLDCQTDYMEMLRRELPKDSYKAVDKTVQSIIREYITNGEMKGLYDMKLMFVNKTALKNRIAAKVYQAHKNGIDVTKGLKTTIQGYASPYCMRLNPREERAICALYKAAKMDHKNPNTQNISAEAIFDLAYTFFCLRVRKTYAVYEKALKKCGAIEDGLLAATYGLACAMDEYDFTTPLESGMGPDRLAIPIRNEIKTVLNEANEFSISEATWRKIFAYDAEKHKDYDRNQLAKEFHAAPATVDMMLLYGNAGIVSLDEEMGNNNTDQQLPLEKMLGEEEEGYFYTELTEVLDKVLDDDQRVIFDHVFYDGMTYREIANKLDLPERKVKYLFELCRKKLRPYYDTGVKKKKDKPEKKVEKKTEKQSKKKGE
jgi:RNA polymerase sigma factor (sigma-70 family)